MSVRTSRLSMAIKVAALFAFPITAILNGSETAAESPTQTDRNEVQAVKVITDKAADCSSLKTIATSVTRGCKTNDEKAIALYNFLRLAHYHQGYPNEKGGIPSIKLINVYGWSLCGGLHTVEAALWREMGWGWRYVGWRGHTTVEAFYDGQWHYLDTFLKFYTWRPDPKAPGGRTIASQDDIEANPGLINDMIIKDKSRGVYYFRDNRFEVINDKANWVAPALFVCGDTPSGVINGVKTTSVGKTSVKTGHMGIKFDAGDYSTDVDLALGDTLTLNWGPSENGYWWSGRKWKPGHSCRDKEYRNCPSLGPIMEPYRDGVTGRTWANGELRIAPDPTDAGVLDTLAAHDNVKQQGRQWVPSDASRPASITLAVASPYVMSLASGKADGADKVEVSVDGGKSFKAANLDDFSERVGGKYEALVRLTFSKALSAVEVTATVQCNRSALPYLSPGKNVVTVSVADPKKLGKNALLVTYAYQTGSRSRSYEKLADSGYEIGRAHGAKWSDEVTVVQKRFTADQLPTTFEIDVPTRKGDLPVYPRMMFLRREIVSPKGTGLALPADAIAPKVSPKYTLATLPNPFLIGIARPPKRVIRPTVTKRITLTPSHVVSNTGTAPHHHFLKWRSDNKDTWALLVGGDLSGLPAAKEISAARLIVPIVGATPKSKTKIGATLLRDAFQPGQSYDVKRLGGVVGTAVVKKLPNGQHLKSPELVSIDVSRGVKGVAASDVKFHGFGIRTLQDRSVDDGWTVRVDLQKGAPIILELDVYSDTKK